MTRRSNSDESPIVTKASRPRTLDDFVHSFADGTKSAEDGLFAAFGEVEVALR